MFDAATATDEAQKFPEAAPEATAPAERVRHEVQRPTLVRLLRIVIGARVPVARLRQRRRPTDSPSSV
jgi:hypothetical protein